MQIVSGIGGLFFRARDPASLSRWYADHLGVTAPPAGYGEAGIAVEPDPETHPNGRFARLADPEGDPIELWEPNEPRS